MIQGTKQLKVGVTAVNILYPLVYNYENMTGIAEMVINNFT